MTFTGGLGGHEDADVGGDDDDGSFHLENLSITKVFSQIRNLENTQ